MTWGEGREYGRPTPKPTAKGRLEAWFIRHDIDPLEALVGCSLVAFALLCLGIAFRDVFA